MDDQKKSILANNTTTSRMRQYFSTNPNKH